MASRTLVPLLALSLALLAVGELAAAGGREQFATRLLTNFWDRELAARVTEVFDRLPPPAMHYASLSRDNAERVLRQDAKYSQTVREKLEGRWFAALVGTSDDESVAIQGRFDSWRGLVEFLAERNALVEVWAWGEGLDGQARRIPAPELSELRRQRHERPTFITVTYPDPVTGKIVTYRVEFGFEAAAFALASNEGYQSHRKLQFAAREILDARNTKGQPDALAQWEALQASLSAKLCTVVDMPAPPQNPGEVWVACEYEVDDRNNFRRVVRFYRDNEIRRQVSGDMQILVLQKAGEQTGREVMAYHQRGLSDRLERVPNPIPGQDAIELRVKDPLQADVRKWHVLEFGAPEVLKQSALAQFSLVNAYLEKDRKALGVKQANMAFVVEPIIAGLNIGGGLSGVGFPIGAAARLAYNTLVMPRFIADVPSVKEMRGLFQILAAKDKHPQLRLKPAEFLDAEDIKTLRESLKHLSDAEVAEYLKRISDEDLKAMLRIARMQRIDAKVTNLLTIIANAGLVSGWTDMRGLQRDIFNNIYFSVTGEISINYIIAALAGMKVTTPASGASLYDLSRGHGPAEAWLQYLNATVDVRAVVNTVARLTHRGLANKELKQPFPYAPRMTDLAAYEFRVFGFPLLIFYKRGLIKSDYAAYQNDYAYGLLGVKIVEHFRTREALETEIRAGHVVPLGYVRVPAIKGGWVETDLAVFAHRIAEGKYRGKTALIIYGLKAYIEQSNLIRRERERFMAFAKGLQEGAVIEQVLAGESAPALPSRALEPEVHIGPDTARERYEPLLGSLLELRRYALRESWGLPLNGADRQQTQAFREELAARGIDVPEGNPIVDIDAFNSSLIYRRRINGQVQEVKVTRIPSLADIDRELQKAADAELIEEARRDAAAGKIAGVVLLNRVLEIDGRLEVGPLLRDREGQVKGAGLIRDAQAVEDFFRIIERLPVVDRARLRYNHFAATVVELDTDGNGVREKVFLTLEFPLGEVRHEWTNPLSGEREALLFARGQWRQTLTKSRIVEMDYDAAGVEIRSRTFANSGSLPAPVRGELIEETRTVDVWFRSLDQPDLDPYQPAISKLRANYVTGQLARETYGLFPLPIELADDQYVTRTRYTEYGLFDSASVFENGRSQADFQRPALDQALNPIAGRERFHLTCRLPDLSALRDLSASDYQTTLERVDLSRGVVRTETVDSAHFGRKTREIWVDSLDGTRSFTNSVTLEYDDDFHYGLIPARTVTSSGFSETHLAEATVVAYDPLRRRLTAVEEDYTGVVRTNTWDSRWASPVEIETGPRRTVQEFNRDETAVTGTTMLKSTGETFCNFTGKYDATLKVFEITRALWYRPGIAARVETNTYSGLGKLVSTRVGDALEVRVDYTRDGTEQARQTFSRDPATGRFSILQRQEDDYLWQKGARRARVRTWIEGVAHDEYTTLSDAEGRTVVNEIREWPGLALRTELTYDGDSERVLQAEVRQNGQVRSTRRALREVVQPDGAYWLQVEVIPFWGLTSTNRYPLGDPLGRVATIEFENGRHATVAEWFADSAIPKVTELRDRQGRPIERLVRRPGAGVEVGLAYDEITRYQLSPWSEMGFVETKAIVRGAEVTLFQEAPDGRIFFDLTKPYEAPLWSVDRDGRQGISAIVGGTARSNVTAFFKNQLREDWASGETSRPVERVLELETVDLHGLFYHKVSRRVADRMGSVLGERTGKIANLGPRPYSEAAIFAETAGVRMTRNFKYSYEAGWFSEQVERQTGRKQMVFTTTQPPPDARSWSVNESGWRESPTRVLGREAATEGPVDREASGEYSFRTVHEPRVLAHNPYLPGVTNVWTAWTSTELSADGRPLFDIETILDAAGKSSTTVARRINSRGRPADKITFQLPLPDPQSWRALTGQPGGQTVRMNLAGPEDFSPLDFIAFYLDASGARAVDVWVRDSIGHDVFVTNALAAPLPGALSFWPPDDDQVQWLPGEFAPARGSAVVAPAASVRAGNVFVISVPELAKAGLDIRRLTGVDLDVSMTAGDAVRVSSLYRLAHGGLSLVPKTPRRLAYDDQSHSSGLRAFTRTKLRRTEGEMRSQLGRNSLLRYNGMSVGMVRPHGQPPYYPILYLTDHADPDSARPLYAVAAEDGRFLEYYQTLAAGDRHVFTAANGFESPKLEVFRARVLDDELSPGMLVFGRDDPLTIPLSKGQGGFSSAIANLQNRCAASVFTLGGDRLRRLIFGVSPAQVEFSRLAEETGPAASQAAAINELPMLAGALSSGREVPWARAAAGPGITEVPNLNPKELGTRLYVLAGYFPITKFPNTKLIPTSVGTEAERFVDTVEEGAIIELAVELDEISLARELLSFYLQESEGGTTRLHSVYDASTGAALTKESRYERPRDSSTTAGAQLAIAQAAFCLGMATGDPNALEFGRNLVSLLLNEFRPNLSDLPWPRGIAERSTDGAVTWHGITLWPEARSFSLKTNARAYLLLSRLAGSLDRFPFEPAWKQLVAGAAGEQAAWLTNRIMPHVLRTGVVPKGLFELQDVHDSTYALAAERWTAADDWLAFVEAVDRIGISKELNRSWMDNLARVHGVTIDGNWGLDWCVPLQRPDAISTELTMRFVRVANQLGYQQAAEFARQNLARLYATGRWPVVVTTANTNALLPTGQGSAIYPVVATRRHRGGSESGNGWPETLGVAAELAGSAWPTDRIQGSASELPRPEGRDITRFFWTAAGFYLAIVAVTLSWWGLSAARKRRRAGFAGAAPSGPLVSDRVMEKAEERWAKRVLGMRLPARAEQSRYSNGAIEQNFHIQLRATYKLVLEWRRMINEWSEDDPRLVENGADEWLNGMDEFAVMVGVYSRWVVKAGKKDGNRQADVLQENEDSNHIWSRLVIYFSESHLGLLGLLKEYKAHPESAAFVGVNDQIELVLRTLGVRARSEPFDAREAFDVPGDNAAFDLLILQAPGASLGRIVEQLERRLGIPAEHVSSFIKSFKSFKEREQLFPVHPYLLELAKVLPHFLLMGLVALIWHNHDLRGLAIYPYLKELTTGLALDWQHSWCWALPLFLGFMLSAAAHYVEEYRYRWRTRSLAQPQMALDATVSSFFAPESQAATPTLRRGRWWNPLGYQRAGWILRAVGMVWLALTLFRLEPPTFATFMFVKGVVAVILLIEAAATLVPLVVSRLSRWLEDRVASTPNAGALTRFVNQLNLVSTRPASLIWLSIKYHFQPSVPTGGALPMFQAATFYVVFNAVFFAVGSYMYKQALEVWFQETYGRGWNLGLVFGGLLFWNTMYLLRFGLFILFASLASALTLYPFKVLGGLAAALCVGLQLFDNPVSRFASAQPWFSFGLAMAGLALMAFEAEALAWLTRLPPFRRRAAARLKDEQRRLEQYRSDTHRTVGIVYMSGDDLSYRKLTAELLMTRASVLRDQLDSGGVCLLSKMRLLPDDDTLSQWFNNLYALEKKHEVTLWHPLQLVIRGEPAAVRPELGLNLIVDDAGQREQLLAAWHVRRWLVTMMSGAGHAQDTAINLVDIALRVAQERLGARTAFYLIQNKYDNSDQNRPSQVLYDEGELGQRDKLARLLMEMTPGSRAYNINDWTPFGFKAGGLVGMDLVHEESLKLTNMLVLDRNANAHDLESLMADLRLALCDPGVVIVIPGRSTTNTLTAVGQSSQLIEEGQRALTRGVMLLGGVGAETLGTGWGNIQAVYYGRVQRALCDPDTPKMPLTRPTLRGAPFGDRWEGLIGFGPHAVGISEDIWGVTQAAHNALALGYQVKFHRSRTVWHKIRESWSHAEWFSAFPRWSGGYLQMMLDPMMQRINDEGPLSVFAKEIRANGGRFFLSAPSALFSILAMPLAIIWDFSPFVQILILLWNLGFVMNQVLTVLGLVACVESTGFSLITAALGAAGAGIAVATAEGLGPFAAPFVVLGFLVGGFAMGLGRWLYYRVRDAILFGPQLVIHALGQVVRQSLEFVLSGASANDAKAVNIAFRAWVGPREDRPFEGYQNFVNLRTVVWGVGLGSLFLNLFALANLDFLNVLLLLPSLMFSVSTLIGPFLMNPKPGRGLGRKVWAPKLLGWIGSLLFYGLVTWLVARGGWLRGFGVLLFAAGFGAVLRAGLRYCGYARRLKRVTKALAQRITAAGVAVQDARTLAQTILRGLGGDVAKTRNALQKAALTPEHQAAVAQMVEDRVLPLLKRPLTDLQRGRFANSRFVCEFNRSFVLGLFTFVWFFIVPIPGLLVFSAPFGYRFMLPLASVLKFAGVVLGTVLGGYGVSLLLEWMVQCGLSGGGLVGRIEAQHRRFQSLAREPGKLTSAQTASLYALFTDVQTYFDQRGYAYARRTLGLIEQTLNAVSSVS
jgi:hypothetical protein